MLTIRQCRIAGIEHNKSYRQYAHTHHMKGDVICVTAAWKIIPIEYKMGLIAHEIGHLLVGEVDHSESEADRLANMFFDIKIRYKDSIYGKKLQYLSDEDTHTVYNWVLDNAKFAYPLSA